MNSNEYWADHFLPDLSEVLKKQMEQIQEVARKMAESLFRVQEAIRPLSEAIATILPQYLDSESFACFSRSFVANRKLGEAQFVYWDKLSDEMIDLLYESQNTDKTLRKLLGKKQFQPIDETVEKTCSHLKNKQQLRVYRQSVEAFKNDQNDLAVSGFVSVFDGVLSEISKNNTAGFENRVKNVIKRIRRQNVFGQKDYSVIALGLSLEKTLKSFATHSDFAGKEPETLNRHWIAHGRSRRKKTKLDCVKMIHLIYGLLLVGDLEKER